MLQAQPSVSIDTGLVRQLIAQQFPQWSGLPVVPVLPGGWDNRTFRLGDDKLVRLPSAAAYAGQVEKEQAWLPKLATQLTLPIPAPIAQGAPAGAYPWPWSVYRWLDGEPASGAGAIGDLREFASALARFLAELQRADTAGAPPPGPHNFFRGGALATYDGETRSALAMLAGDVDAPHALAVWEAALDSRWDAAPVWVHGDIAAGNLLVRVRDGKLCGVIDFGCAAVGDPACDLAIAWTLFDPESRAAFRAALPLDAGAWARGRGWALWKALITLAQRDAGTRAGDPSARVIRQVLDDHCLARA